MKPPRLPPDLADRFELRTGPRRAALVRSDFVPAFRALELLEDGGPPAVLDGSAAAAPAGGRGGTWVAPVGAGREAVIRPGRRGGWMARLNRSRYFVGDRFLEELVLTERLRRRGAPVPEPLAAVRRERTIGYQTWLATLRIPGAEPVAVRLRRMPVHAAEGLMRAAGRALRALHEAGGEHADLNAWNLLLSAGPDDAWAGHVVDLDRGRLWPRPLPGHRARRNLRRLRRSLEKLELTEGLAAWPDLEHGYDEGPAAGRPPRAESPLSSPLP